jgi:hypothetical protein
LLPLLHRRLTFQFFHNTQFNNFTKMNTQELKNFLADSPPSAVNLVIKKHFDALDDKQKRYAHYISRYACPLLWSFPADFA